MRTLFLAGLALFALACNGMPPSSLAACDFEVTCEDPDETCWASQACGPPGPSGLSCREPTGDFKCHRTCRTDSGCASDERCSAVDISDRTDIVETIHLCR